MKILNLYAGIGGNRKLWGDEHEVTAVEYKSNVAKVYQDHFPNDNVVVGDAHQYLLEHFEEFDFIWSSPPCPSHSDIRLRLAVGSGQNKPLYPDMKLYEEIIFLQYHHKGKWCVENVIPYYEPLIAPQQLGNHYFWANFLIPPLHNNLDRKHNAGIQELQKRKGFDLTKCKGIDKRLALRNCVEPELARHILNYALNPIEVQSSLFTIPNEIKPPLVKT